MASFTRVLMRMEGSDPSIWRRFVIRSEASVIELHEAVRDLAWSDGWGWELSTTGRRFVAGHDPQESSVPDLSRKKRVSDWLREEGDRLLHVQDLDDRLVCSLSCEGRVSGPGSALRHLVDGARALPPENCGGVGGFKLLLQLFENGTEREQRQLEHLLDDWRPERFDLQAEQDCWDRDLDQGELPGDLLGLLGWPSWLGGRSEPSDRISGQDRSMPGCA